MTASWSYYHDGRKVEKVTDYTNSYEYILAQMYLARRIINKGNLTAEQRFELKDMLISCYFNYAPCFADNFSYYYDSTY